MARVRGRINGQKVKMDRTQAAQLGLVEGTGIQTGQLDPTEINQGPSGGGGWPDPHMNPPTGTLTPAQAQHEKMARSGVWGMGNPSTQTTQTNPNQQKTMFSTVQAQSKVNPQTDIMRKNPNSWKDLQRKFGLKEV